MKVKIQISKDDYMAQELKEQFIQKGKFSHYLYVQFIHSIIYISSCLHFYQTLTCISSVDRLCLTHQPFHWSHQLSVKNYIFYKATNHPVSFLTLGTGASEVSSGDYGRYITDSRIKDEDGFDVDDSDYDIFIEEVSF